MHVGSRLVKSAHVAKKLFSGAGRAMLAGMAGAVVTAGKVGKILKNTAADLRSQNSPQKNNKSGEVIVMKKSTLVAVLVALAAVAGVLGALYVYVLRREKELDEYEQLLFSEDFNDDIPDFDTDDEEVAEDAVVDTAE